MIHFLLSFSFITTFSAIGQITIDQNDFPGADDTAMISISDETTMDLVTTGADAIWDFTDTHIMSQRIDTFYNMSDASFTYQFIFNNIIFEPDYASDYFYNLVGFDLAGTSGAGITIESPQGFVKITNSYVQNVGMGLILNGIEVPIAADTIDTEFELPMNFSDSWTSNSYMYVDLNPAFDGIFIRYQYRSSEVDGWGEITTPFGTFDALRVKSQVAYDDSVYVDFGFGGTWLELPTPDQNEYTWWSSNNKVPIMRIVTQDIAGNETISRVEFKDMERNLASIETSEEFQGSLYPNPTTNSVNFTFEPGVNQVLIYSISGEIVYANNITSTSLNLDVAAWTPGVYMVKLIGNETVSSTKLIVE